MARPLVIGLVSLLTAAVIACDSEDEATTTTPNLAELQPCDRTKTKFPNLIGWGGSVAGISCKDAGHFVQYEFFAAGVDPAGQPSRHAPRPEKRGGAAVGAYDCHWKVFASQPGWYHVECANESQRFKFNLTP